MEVLPFLFATSLRMRVKGTPQFLVVQKHHTEDHGDMLNTSVIMYVPLAAQKSFPKAASQLNKTHAVISLCN